MMTDSHVPPEFREGGSEFQMDLISFYNILVTNLSRMAEREFTEMLWKAYAPVPALGNGGVRVSFTDDGIRFAFRGWQSEGPVDLWEFLIVRQQVASFPMTREGVDRACAVIEVSLKTLVENKIKVKLNQ